ncbi:MAG: YihA family ribosome biogenesis GTP-binding protein, partial [Gammaproteobacteria bacterium]
IEWADPARRGVHVLLAKADKLNQAERAALLRESRATLGDTATVQVFSAHARMGVDEAQARMEEFWRGPAA